jgi:hypothetical protein
MQPGLWGIGIAGFLVTGLLFLLVHIIRRWMGSNNALIDALIAVGIDIVLFGGGVGARLQIAQVAANALGAAVVMVAAYFALRGRRQI